MTDCYHNLITEVPATVPVDVVNKDSEFLNLCRENIQTFVHKIFKQLPHKKTESGVIGILAPIRAAGIIIPRARPIPTKKPLSKWEKYARDKGIRKNKKGVMLYDKVTDDWKPRYGRKSLRRQEEERTFMIEHKTGSDVFTDPFAQQSKERRLRKAEQKMKEIKNKVLSRGYKLPSMPVKKAAKAANPNTSAAQTNKAVRKSSRGKTRRA